MGAWRAISRLHALGFALVLVGCAGAQLPPDPRPDLAPGQLVQACCADAEPYPDWMVRLTEAAPPFVVPWMGTVNFRIGYLAKRADGWALVEPALRPLDILVYHSDGRLSSRLIPGHFSHGALYLGTEAQLRAQGIWHAAWMAPYRDAIREGRVLLDSVTGGVRLIDIEELSDTDAVGVVRPQLNTVARSGRVHRHVLEAVGTPFDFDFDASDDSRLFCMELIAQAMPELALPVLDAYGRTTILPDSAAAMALTDPNKMTFVGYLRGEPKGWRTGPARLMALDIRKAWGL
ncbi:MAG: YiiX/YebB-like N1pC/P60 family cysteine hydrolase [Paracoccaceae bacterium]|nr:YiiX/YebB-like N1pC/P60 family cysteine hydrolase [Paracoccaceae bacterium]